jgi:hypothetical protein
MTDDRLSGLALISASGGMIITMSLHPTGHVGEAQVEPMIHMLIAVHALALACVPLMFLGTWGLSRRLASPDLCLSKISKCLSRRGIILPS